MWLSLKCKKHVITQRTYTSKFEAYYQEGTLDRCKLTTKKSTAQSIWWHCRSKSVKVFVTASTAVRRIVQKGQEKTISSTKHVSCIFAASATLLSQHTHVSYYTWNICMALKKNKKLKAIFQITNLIQCAPVTTSSSLLKIYIFLVSSSQRSASEYNVYNWVKIIFNLCYSTIHFKSAFYGYPQNSDISQELMKLYQTSCQSFHLSIFNVPLF